MRSQINMQGCIRQSVGSEGLLLLHDVLGLIIKAEITMSLMSAIP